MLHRVSLPAMKRSPFYCALILSSLLAGCDMLGIESPEKVAAARDADGRAIGGACRHAGWAIEDCYSMNKKADRAAVFAGWRDMNDYMRENKIDTVPPAAATQVAAAGGKEPQEDAEAPPAKKPATAKTPPPPKEAK